MHPKILSSLEIGCSPKQDCPSEHVACISIPAWYSARRSKCYGTTLMPMDLAWCITDRQKPSKDFPACLGSDILILAISYTCLRLMLPIVSWPGLFAPRLVPDFLPWGALAARRRRCDAWGVRTSNEKLRSLLTHIRHGIGVPGVICAVLALNSWRTKFPF